MKTFRFRKKTKPIEIAPNPQLERMEILKAEIYRLENKLKEFENREREITEVLAFAKERAEEYEKEARLRYMLEKERLCSYRNKWTERLKALNDADKLGEEIIECNEYFKRISKELKSIIEGEDVVESDVEKSYNKELERLKELSVSEEKEVTLSEEDLNKLLLQFNY